MDFEREKWMALQDLNPSDVAADYACDGTASDTVLPICLNDMVENYLYDEEEVATAVVAWKNVRTAASSTTKPDFLTYIRTLRGDKRFRLYS